MSHTAGSIPDALLANPIRRARGRRRIAVVAAAAALAIALVAVQSCQSVGTPPPSISESESIADPALPRQEPDLRVRIRSTARSVELDADAPLLIASRPVAPPATISLIDDRFRVRTGTGEELAFDGGRPLSIARSTDSGLLDIDRQPHPGSLELHPRRESSSGARAFDVIELVPIETYLPGVIAKELYASWKRETFEAQAIAARSYALHEALRQRARGRHYDLESTTRDQVYGGATANTTAHRAVRATAGRVLLDEQGRLLRAYYSSDCGGRPASAADVFPTTAGYEFNLAAPIQATSGPRRDYASFSPVNRWTVVRPKTDLTRRLAEYGRRRGLPIRDLGALTRIEAAGVNAANRPTRYRIHDRSGRIFTLTAESLRNACNQTVEGLPEITRSSRVLSGDAAFRLRGRDVVIEGRGFGHGVGLCQFGAEGLAREGGETSEILSHFYPGAQIVRLYSPQGPTAGAFAR